MPFEELIFTEVVAKHMADVGMTCGEPTACHYAARVGNANVRLSGFAVSDEGDQLDLFVSLYQGARELTSIADAEVAKAAEHCARFLAACVEGRLGSKMDESNDAYPMVLTIEKVYSDLDQIRIYVLRDGIKKTPMGAVNLFGKLLTFGHLNNWSQGWARRLLRTTCGH